MHTITTEGAISGFDQTSDRAARRRPSLRSLSTLPAIGMVIGLAVVSVPVTSAVVDTIAPDRSAVATACVDDAPALSGAALAFLAAEGVRTIPATGTGPDRFEQTLVEAGYLATPSAVYDLGERGAIVLPEASPC